MVDKKMKTSKNFQNYENISLVLIFLTLENVNKNSKILSMYYQEF